MGAGREDGEAGPFLIGDAGATALAGAIEKNTGLTGLYLYRNNIGDAGAVALAGALEKNTVLTGLGLHSNKIGDAGATALAGALEKNTVLTKLILTNNNIGDAGNAALCLLRKRKPNLDLWLASLPWPLGGIDSLCKNVEERAKEKAKKKEQKDPESLLPFLSANNMEEHFGILTK